MAPADVDLAIIGGGFSGIASALALQRQHTSGANWRIAIIDPNPTLPAGTAFAGARAEHLLNVRASQMSLYVDHPSDFCDYWEREADESPSGSSAELFAPRALYARYLAHRLAQARAAGAKITHHPTRVTAMARVRSEDTDRSLWLIQTELAPIRSRFVVLATGARQNDGMLGHARVFQGPWQLRQLPPDPVQQTALIVGGGLTAIDALQSLVQLQWRGKIILVAPRAKLSEHHVDHHVATWSLPADFLSQCADPHAALRAVRAQLRQASQQQGDWRSVINALRPLTSAIFSAWSSAQRAQFLRHLAGIWNRHRHRAPPSSAAFVAELLARGQLKIQAGRVKKLGASHNFVQAEIRSGTQEQSILCNLVIDARGGCYRTTPLLQDLADAGFLQLSETGFGVVADADGLVGVDLYALGANCFGERLETTAVPELRVQAEVIAQRIAGALDEIASLRPQ